MSYFATASSVFRVVFSPWGWGWDGRVWFRTHRSTGGWQWRMTPSHVAKVTDLEAGLPRCCRNPSTAARGRWREGSQQNILGNTPPSCPDMKHSLPSLDTPASGHNISSDLHSPSGVIHHVPLPLPLPSHGNPATRPFLLRSHWLTENLLFQFWCRHCLENWLCPWRKWVNGINLWSVRFWRGWKEWTKLDLVFPGPRRPACQCSNIWVLWQLPQHPWTLGSLLYHGWRLESDER